MRVNCISKLIITPIGSDLKITQKIVKTIIIVVFFIGTFSIPHFSLIENKFDTIERGYIEVNADDIRKIIPNTSSNDNGDDIEAIFGRKINDYDNLGYFPQIYEPSLQATYYGLYILEALGKLGNINQTKIIDYILDHYSEDLHIFIDKNTHRYLNMNFPQMYYPLSSMLEIHCYAVLSLDILNRLDLVDPQENINFIWNCFNPEGEENGFIGQPYDDGLVSEFKVATLDNTYFALSTLNLFIDDWAGYGFYLNRLVPFINSLQTINGYDWFFGSFLNDNDLTLDTLGSPLFEPNLISSYYAVKSLQMLNLVDTVRTHEFHTFLNVIYDEQEFKFQVNDISNALDIVATPIGLEMSDITGFSNFSRSETLQFVMNNRNTLGNWDRSTVYKYHELIDTFQIVRSLKEIGEISQLTEQEKEEIANSLSFYKQERGYSLLSADYMSMETINSVVNSFYQKGRIGELDISGLYELIKQACIFNPLRGHILIYASTGMDQNIIGFRSYPIEYYKYGNLNETNNLNFLRSHKTTYMTLNSLKRIFKLNDLGVLYDLREELNAVLNSQFQSIGNEFHGAFLPFPTSIPQQYQTGYITFENSFYAIKLLNLLADHLDLGDIESLSFNKTALYQYVKSNVYESDTVIHFNPQYCSDIESLTENTYYMAYLLKELGLFDLNSQKIRNFIYQNIDTSSLKILYYHYKLSEILDLQIVFNYSYTNALVQDLYSSEFNEYYSDPNTSRIEQANFFRVVDMALNDDLQVNCEYNQEILLGQVNSITASFRNIILTDFGNQVSIFFESPQLGVLNLEKQTESNYYVNFLVPERALNYPKVEGIIRVYDYIKEIGQCSISFLTSYNFHSNGLKVTTNNNSVNFEFNVSYEFASGLNPAENSRVQTKIYKNDIYFDSQLFDRVDNFDHSRFTLYFEPDKDFKYYFDIVLIDEYHPNGISLYQHTISSSEEPIPDPEPTPDPDNPPTPNTILVFIISLLIPFVFYGVLGYIVFRIISAIFRRKRKHSPMKVELEIKNTGNKGKGNPFNDIFSSEED